MRRSIYFLFTIIICTQLHAQSYDGVYQGAIACGKKDFTNRLCIYLGGHNFYYARYQEFTKKGNQLVTEIYGRGMHYPNGTLTGGTTLLKMNLVNEKNSALYSMSQAPASNRGWGFQADFNNKNILSMYLTAPCKEEQTMTRVQGADDIYAAFKQEIAPFVEADKWQKDQFSLPYRIDSNRRVVRIKDKEWIMAGFYNNSSVNTRVYLPYPLICTDHWQAIVIGENRQPAARDITMAVLNTYYHDNNYLKCQVPDKISYTVYVGSYSGLEYPQEVYSTTPHQEFYPGKMPDLDARSFACGKVKLDKKSVGELDVTVPDSLYLTAYRNDFSCAIDKAVQTILPNRVNLGNYPIVVRVMDPQGKFLGQHQLFPERNYGLNLSLDEALVKTPADQRVNFDVLGLSEPSFFRSIHYGLFGQASEMLTGRILSAAGFTYYMLNYQSMHRDFVTKNAIDIPVTYTKAMVDHFGNKDVLREDKFNFKVEPRYAKTFSDNINSLISLQNWNSLNFLVGGRQSRMGDDIREICNYLLPESKASLRFRENLFRFVTNQPALTWKSSLEPVPVFDINGSLVSSEMINLIRCTEELTSRPANRNYSISVIQYGKITGSIVRATYKTSAGNEVVRYFWNKSDPGTLAERLTALGNGHPLVIGVGPAVDKAPADLKTAVALMQ